MLFTVNGWGFNWRYRELDNTVRQDLAAFQSEPNGILFDGVEALPANELEKKTTQLLSCENETPQHVRVTVYWRLMLTVD